MAPEIELLDLELDLNDTGSGHAGVEDILLGGPVAGLVYSSDRVEKTEQRTKLHSFESRFFLDR